MCAYVELAPTKAVATSAKVDTVIAPVIPQSPAVILPVIGDIVDKFWECRRYGEPWDSSNPPSGFFDDCGGPSIEAMTRRVHRRLVFDLVAETINEIYRSENDDDHCHCPDAFSVAKPAAVRRNPEPPTTLDSLRPRVESRVLRQLGLPSAAVPSTPRWSNRRKQDAVDWLLVKELGEEELGWVDYTGAAFDVKIGIVDSLMELLLNDTVLTIQQVMQFRQMTVE